MDTRRTTVSQAFPERIQYVVPSYQRNYIWTKEDQWEPLWDDVLEVTRRVLGNESNQEPHFLGTNAELSEVVQGLALRSKEPPKGPNTVGLLTVHGSKGLEFQTVYLLGLAEGVMPSWQSLKKGDASPEMEEERRNCFVAITRTEKRLILTAAKKYRGWNKEYSRFLSEMSIAD